MLKVNCGVIGVGYLGQFHAEKLAKLPNANLVAVCDTHLERAKEVAALCQTEATTDVDSLLDKVDAVAIVTQTQYHFDIAKKCLQKGIHVLLEKTMTETLEQARELIDLANENKCILQIGHLERFNPARSAVESHLDNPRFIDSTRLSPFNPRGTDVNVILDLMIHDIDLIQSIVQSPIKSIDAQGAPVLTDHADIASVRIRFENNCVANVTASRISFKTERKMRIFQKDTYLSLDLHHKKFAIFHKGEKEMFPGIPEIIHEETAFEKSDALLVQAEAFLSAIQNKTKPIVSGEDGYDALKTAIHITNLINDHLTETVQ